MKLAAADVPQQEPGLRQRVAILESLVNALAEYASDLAHQYNSRVGALERQVHGDSMPEPYFPPHFTEWYERREKSHLARDVAEARKYHDEGHTGSLAHQAAVGAAYRG